MDFVSRANRVHVDPDLLLKVVLLTGFAHDDPEASQYQMETIVKVLQGAVISDEERSMAAASMSFRLEALTRLVLSTRKHGWAVPGATRETVTPEILTRCACEERVIVHNGRAAFNPASFGQRLITLLAENHRADPNAT